MSSFRVPYFVGNTGGRDHIYPPTIERADLSTLIADVEPGLPIDALWPVGVNLATIMALAWRVKRWTISGSLFLDYGGTDNHLWTPASTSGGFSSFDSFGTPIAVTNERQIIGLAFNGSMVENRAPASLGNAGIQINGAGTVVDNGITSPFPLAWIVSLLPQVTTFPVQFTVEQFVMYDPALKLFYPPLDIQMGVSTVDNHFPGQHVRGTGWATGVPAGSVVIDPVVAPSFAVPLTLNNTVAPTIVNTLKLTADQFFPYKNSAGNPVYDAATGAQLLDPLS